MTISGDEHPLYKELVGSLVKKLNLVRLNAKSLGESDLIKIADEIIKAFEKLNAEIKEEFEEMKRKFYGTCPACGGALGPNSKM